MGIGASLGSLAGPPGMAIGGLADAGLQAVGGILNMNAARDASAAQQKAAANASDMVNKYYDKATGQFSDYTTAGSKAVGNLSSNNYSTDPNAYKFGYKAFQPTAMPSDISQDPGYQFRLQQGNQAVQNSAAARGSGLSGATLKALDKYSSGLASEEYQNAFNRNLQSNQFGAGQNQLNNVLGMQNTQQQYTNANQQQLQARQQQENLANMGYGAAGQSANLLSGQGRELAGIEGQRGNAEAAGIMGSSIGNIISGLGGGRSTDLSSMFNFGGDAPLAKPGSIDYSQGTTYAAPGSVDYSQGTYYGGPGLSSSPGGFGFSGMAYTGYNDAPGSNQGWDWGQGYYGKRSGTR